MPRSTSALPLALSSLLTLGVACTRGPTTTASPAAPANATAAEEREASAPREHADAGVTWSGGGVYSRRQAAVAFATEHPDLDASAALPTLVAELKPLLADPRQDASGERRAQLARALGLLGDPAARDVLLALLATRHDQAPRAVHREAITALGRVRAPDAAEPLLLAPLRLPDTPSTTDVSARARQALSALGVDAIAPLVALLEGRLEPASKLATSNGIPTELLGLIAMGDLAATYRPEAVPALLELQARTSCATEGAPDPDRPAFLARGFAELGDARAVPGLCACARTSKNLAVLAEVAGALGSIGGQEATACLIDLIKRGESPVEQIASEEFRHELRWLAAHHAATAATPADVPTIRAAIDRNDDPKVREMSAPVVPGLELLTNCRDDPTCYASTLEQTHAAPIEREVAASRLARLRPGDEQTALAVARAYAVKDPDARVSMARLVPRILAGKRCDACAEAMGEIHDRERGSLDATYQLPVMTARAVMSAITGFAQ